MNNRALRIIWIGLPLIVSAAFIYLGYHFRWKWTGFPQKELFDWIQILVIPAAVAIGTFILNREAKRRDDKAEQARKKQEEITETERAEEAVLEAYLNYMSRMVTDPGRPLRRTYKGDDLSLIARAQTLTVLNRLQNGDRKRRVWEFLYEVGLINRPWGPAVNREAKYPIIELKGANFEGANFQGAELVDTELKAANLRGANFQGARLANVNLEGADLRNANFQEAWLVQAHLKGANLSGSDLRVYEYYSHGLEDDVREAIGDENTILPEWIDRPKSWTACTNERTEDGQER